MGHPNCQTCYYFCRTTDTCDYWLIADRLRGCPPGAGCLQKISRKGYKKMGYAPKWDRASGREMWLAGKSDKEIAEAFGVHVSAVGSVRRKVWEKENQASAPDLSQATETEPAKCRENTTAKVKELDIFDAVEIVVRDKKGMTAVVTGQAVLALRNGDLAEALRCVNWLIEREGKA